ncbi:MAG: ABC transporter permease subunit [Candidatus Aminicenantes bacterium]|nr:MAG: ABC transporter permease subunit [Candidatus Aminicenantes bacterium]
MIAIEFKRVLQESIIIFLVLVGLLVGILTTDKDVYLAPVFEIFLLLYASFTGWSIFDRERNEGAMEYLLSLPVSRIRLLLIKLMPRLVSMGLMLVFYMFLHSRFEFPSQLPVLDFSIFYITFFLVSLSFSLSLKSFISAFFLTGLLSGGLTLFNHLLAIGKSDSAIYLQANVSLLIFPVLFFVMFHFYDVKPAFSFNIKFAGLGIGFCILIIGITYFFVGATWCHYFLTDSGDIFRFSPGQSQLINKEQKIIKRFPGHQVPLLQQGSSLYVKKSKGHTFPETINILNLETGESELLYQPDKGWVVMFDSFESTGIIRGEHFYVLLGNFEEKKYKIVEMANGKFNETPITGNFNFDKDKKSFLSMSLVDVSADRLRFIITWEETLYRVDKTGNSQALLEAEFLSLWNNRLLVFNKTGMTLFEIPGQGELKPIFTKKGNIKKVRRRFASIYSRKVLVRDQEQGKYFIFSLEDNNFEEIPMPYHPYFYLEKGNRFIIVWASGDEISVGEIKDGKLVMKKEWVTPIPIRGIRIIRVYNPGVVIYNPKEFETYWFEW